MNKIIYLLFFFLPKFLSAQDLHKDYTVEEVFQVLAPKGYMVVQASATQRSECFDDDRIMESALTCIGYRMESADKEVIVYLNLRPSHYAFHNRLHGKENLDEMHRITIRIDFCWTLWKERHVITEEDWQKNTTYYPSKYAKEIYNADTLVTYHFWPKKIPIYRDKYVGSQAILGQKNGRGFFVAYCFYTEKAKKNLDKYLKEIEGFVRFREED